MKSPRHALPPHLFAAALWGGILAGGALASRDVRGLLAHGGEDVVKAAGLLLARMLILGAASGCAVLFAGLLYHWIADRFRRWPGGARWIPGLVLAGMAWPVWRSLTHQSLSGAAVSKSPWAAPLSVALPWVLLGFHAVGLRLAAGQIRAALGGGRGRGVLFVLGFTVLGALLDEADRRLYPGLYLHLHDVLATGALLAITLAGGFLLARWGPRRRGAALGMIVVLASLAADRWMTAGPRERFLLHARTLEGRRVLEIWDAIQGGRPPRKRDDLPVEAFRRAREASLRRASQATWRGSATIRNVLWVTVDTLRRDHLGCYGYRTHPTSPNLDAFAAGAAVFEAAHAQFPITSLSFQSMFYGRFPSATPLFQAMQGRTLDPPLRTLAEILRGSGIRTAGLPAIAGDDLNHPAYSVLGKGFESIPSPQERVDISEAAQARRAMAYLRELSKDRFFLWVHLMGPHHPYVLHQEDFGTRDVDRYDSEIAETDRWIGRILDVLGELGLEETTVVIINADHGEAFGEHGSRFHGTTLYEEQIGVPLLIRVPGATPRRLKHPVGNVDVMPTVLSLMDVPAPGSLQGRNLLGLLQEGDASPEAPMAITFSEIPPAIPAMSPANTDRFAVVGPRWKFIRNERAGFDELYDLVEDPGEERNRAGEGFEEALWLEAAVEVFKEESARLVRSGKEKTAEEKIREARALLELKALPARCNALMRLLMGKDTDLAPFFREVWDDPGQHFLMKNLVVLMAPEVLGEDFPQAAEEILKEPFSAGTLVALLEVIADNVGDEPPPSLKDALAKRLDAPHGVARRAAEILALWGDPRGRAVLEEDLLAMDPILGTRAAVALARLGSPKGVALLEGEILPQLADAATVTSMVDALTRLRDRDALEILTEVAQNRYLHHGIKRAILRYLQSLDRLEEAEFALVGLLAGWDPEVGRLVGRAVEERLGEERLTALRRAARLADSARELGKQSRALDAAAAFVGAAEEMETAEGKGRFLLEAGRQAWLAGPRGRATLRVVLGELERWVPAEDGEGATALAREVADLRRRSEEDVTMPTPGSLRVEEVATLCRGPLWGGQEVRIVATVRNTGDTFLSGGDWSGAARLAVVWPSESGAAGVPAGAVPFGGIAPGEAVRVDLTARAPSRAGVFSPTVRALAGAHATLQCSAEGARLHPISVLGDDPLGRDPRGFELSGGELLMLTWRSPAVIGGVVNGEGNVEWEAVLVDPILTLPPFKSVKGSLTLQVELALDSMGLIREDHIECYASWDPKGRFAGGWRGLRDISPDGRMRVLEFEIPPDADGMSPRFLRIDPGTFPHLVTVKAVRILP